jgi:hypothetical protein
MWSVRWNVDCLSRADCLLDAAKSELQFAHKNGECLFEIMAMRRWASPGWDVHIDQAETARSVSPGKKDGVGISKDPDVKKLSVSVWMSNCKGAVQVVCRDRHTGMRGLN